MVGTLNSIEKSGMLAGHTAAAARAGRRRSRLGNVRLFGLRGRLALLRRFVRHPSEDAVASFLFLGERSDLARVGAAGLAAAHRAVPLEHDSVVNHQARRDDVAEELARPAGVYAPSRVDGCGDLAADHHGVAVDLR